MARMKPLKSFGVDLNATKTKQNKKKKKKR